MYLPQVVNNILPKNEPVCMIFADCDSAQVYAISFFKSQYNQEVNPYVFILPELSYSILN